MYKIKVKVGWYELERIVADAEDAIGIADAVNSFTAVDRDDEVKVYIELEREDF